MASTKATVQSFEQAEEFLAGGRNKDSRSIANNTYVERRTEDRIAIRLHATDVVEFTRSGLIFVNTGGWRTVTTKDRINAFIPGPLNLISRRGVWRVTTKTKVYPATESWQEEHVGVDWDDTVPFADNMAFRRVNDKWEPVEGTFPSVTEEEKISAARKALDKSIKGYLARVDTKVEEWKVALTEKGSLDPSSDPWCCTMGIGEGSNDHLWQHLREGYVFLTLLRKAYEDSGRYRDPVQRLLMDIQFGEGNLKRELRKYLLKHLDPALSVRTEQEKAQKYVEYAEEALTRPSDFVYFGDDESMWVTSAPTFGRNRDSENIEIANYEIVWENLVEKFPDLVKTDQDRKEENPGGIYVFGASHWACGWIEQIVVPVLRHPGAITADNLHPAFIQVCEAVDAVRLYPALPGAEERASVADVEAEIKDVRSWLDYLSGSHEWPIDWLNEHDVHAEVYRFGEEYAWESDQIKRAVVSLAEQAAHDENNATAPGQGVLL